MMLMNGSSSNGSSSHTSRSRPRVCLDTGVFVALFSQEEAKWKIAHDILQDARENRVQVLVSALVLVECETPPNKGVEQAGSLNGGVAGGVATAKGTADVVADFFESEFLTRCNVDPFTGELARRLRYDLAGVARLAPNAWLWLATALLTECDYMMTYDRQLHKLAGQAALGRLQVVPPARPWDAGQLSLHDVDGVMADGKMDLAPLVGTVRSRTIEI